MHTSRIAIVAALFSFAAIPANAACNVSGGIISFTMTGQLNESDCASATVVNGQQGQLDEHEDRLDAHKKAITHNYKWDAKQQKQINRLEWSDGKQWKAIGHLKKENWQQWQAIGDLSDWNKEQDGRLDAHQAILSQHSKEIGQINGRLDKHEKGLAIAIAMPDAYLQQNENFAIAGNLGFFDDETALAFAAIGRINQTWSVNAGLGSDTGFKEVGGKVGLRAGW